MYQWKQDVLCSKSTLKFSFTASWLGSYSVKSLKIEHTQKYYPFYIIYSFDMR